MQSYLFFLFLGGCLSPTAHASPTRVNIRSNSVSNPVSDSAIPSATLDSGVVVGKSVPVGTDSQVYQFLGIPFGQPPVGDLRFAPPQTAQSWSSPRNATTYSATCMQVFGSSGGSAEFEMALFDTPPPVPNIQSEDCLYLNVYMPGSPSVQDKPVLFWIYGGGYQFGTGSLPLYDGTSLAANQDIIVVTFNYRVNVFGYPMSPQLPLTQRNLGHLDQRLALDWVQRNIQAFGGDPNKVTIAGESAGAFSVDDLITTFPQQAPFRAAILESGQDTARTPPLQLAGVNTTMWTELLSAVNCASGSDAEILTCVRALSADTLTNVTASQALQFTPLFDNVTRLENPATAVLAGNVAKVPTLIGSNYNDGTVFTIQDGSNVTEYVSSSLGLPPNLTDWVLGLYAPSSPYAHGLTNGSDIIARIYTDMTFFCPSVYVSNITTLADSSLAWMYLFNATFPNTQHPQYPQLGAYHSSEISLIFGTYPRTNVTDEQIELSGYMQKAWADFVKQPSNGPGWAPYPALETFTSVPGEQVVNTTTLADVQGQVCAFWEAAYEKAAAGVGL